MDGHLYVMLQENAMNRYGIYKLPGMRDVTADEAPRRLPRAVQHIGFTLVGTSPHFEAVGSKIVVTGEGDTISPKSTRPRVAASPRFLLPRSASPPRSL
jgi:hypothetical protein